MYKSNQRANLTLGHWGFFLKPLILAELGLQCAGSPGRDTVMQCNMQC